MSSTTFSGAQHTARIFISLVFATLLVLLATSCQQKPVFEQQQVFDNQIWNRFDILEMNVEISDAAPRYDLLLEIVHTDRYYTDYLDVNITIYFPSGGMRSRDYTFKLKDANLQWIGKEVKTGIQLEVPINAGMQFQQEGIYKVRIESKMSKYNLQEIESIGLRVKKSEE
jgi:gliding motility-associated lipoprotein GldH